ncbi:hypothetical protein [Dactylosporangium sp. CA-233914]|uniref:hypothetical protein n=1 Tax=Dactylosporangium sp. CA-233914 TaxID=3239934 RepID=UPI003D94D2D3
MSPRVSAFDELLEHRRELAEHRTALAGNTAGAMIDALIAAAPGWSDDDLEDEFCARYGAAMVQFKGGAVEDLVNPDNLATALLAAIDERLHQAEEAGADVVMLQRLLTVVAGVLPFPLSESAQGMVAEHVSARAAREIGRGRTVTGPVLWARDAYGSRWAVVAPFAAAGGPDRWYLWDVDTCGYEVVTTHSGFHPSAESAMAAWQGAVGPSAAGAALTTADDAETLGGLLCGEVEGIRLGGEDQQQYAEYLRSRRLGRAVRDAVRRGRGRTLVPLSADDASRQFGQRLRQLGYPDVPAGDGSDDGPAGAEELATELAGSWSPHDDATLYPFCSPHKVAVAVLHLRDFYMENFAAELVAVLPEWIRFLAEHTGMPAELTDRCLAYASGDLQFPGILDEQGRLNTMARVAE